MHHRSWLFSGILLLLVICLVWLPGRPVQALSIDEFYTIDYSARFSTQDVTGSAPFRVIVTGSAVCAKDLTAPYDLVSEARITGRIVGINRSGGDAVVLNSRYTLKILDLPHIIDQKAEVTETLELQFPPGAPSGEYDIEGQLVEGKVKAVFWLDVTEYLPASHPLGTVSYTQSSASGGSSGSGDKSDPLPTSPPTASVPAGTTAASPAADPVVTSAVPEPSGSVPETSPVVQAASPPAVPAAATGIPDSGPSPAPAPEEPASAPWLVLGLVIVTAVVLGGGLSWSVYRGRNNQAARLE